VSAAVLAAAVKTCLDHSESLLISAEALQNGAPNIAYHLTALSLEEIGKAGIMGMSYTAERHSGERPGQFKKYAEDHVRKLFWAIWSPSLGQTVITPEQVLEIQGFATAVHNKRLQGLYFDFDSDALAAPKDAVSPSELQQLISLTRSRLQLERLRDIQEPPSDRVELMTWFLTATEDQEKRNRIMGKAAMEKLAELKDPSAWMKWLRQEFQRQDVACRKMLEEELRRPPGGASGKDKWRFRIRLRTESHSIRQKEFAWWNKNITWIKFSV
jgi:AbiV family abortive infection protein